MSRKKHHRDPKRCKDCMTIINHLIYQAGMRLSVYILQKKDPPLADLAAACKVSSATMELLQDCDGPPDGITFIREGLNLLNGMISTHPHIQKIWEEEETGSQQKTSPLN